MKKIFDSFLTNAVLVALVVLYMIYDEQRLYPGHPLSEDMLYGGFLALGVSGFGESLKLLFLRHHANWLHFDIGAVIGFVLAFGIGYLIYGTL